LNAPNILTTCRLLLSAVLFVLLGIACAKEPLPVTLLDISLVLFILTALTDMLDGLIARRYKLVTTFGRIADPFADKVLTAGCFIFLLGFPDSFIKPWMVVLILSREFLVSGLRGFIEGQGKQFPAMIWGKLKVTSQYSLIGWTIFYLAHLRNEVAAQYFTQFATIGVIAYTMLTAIAYLIAAIKILKTDEDSKA